MRIFNTLTREKQEFVPVKEGKVGIYACGPTVYNFIHIGNARPLCIFDVLRRYFAHRGYEVTFVQNFTDIDDKIIKKANEEGTTYDKISERYIAEYFVVLLRTGKYAARRKARAEHAHAERKLFGRRHDKSGEQPDEQEGRHHGDRDHRKDPYR